MIIVVASGVYSRLIALIGFVLSVFVIVFTIFGSTVGVANFYVEAQEIVLLYILILM